MMERDERNFREGLIKPFLPVSDSLPVRRPISRLEELTQKRLRLLSELATIENQIREINRDAENIEFIRWNK